MADKPIIEFGIDIDTKDATGKVKSDLFRAGRDGGKSFSDGFSGALTGLVATVGGLLAFRQVSRFISDSVRLSSVQQVAVNDLNIALSNTGRFTEAASADIQQFASTLQALTTVGDEVILKNAALIESVTRLDGESLKAATTAALDLSAALNIELTSASRNISKTYSGQLGELGELVPALKNLTAEQLRNGGAVQLIADLYGGAAQGKVRTFAGAIQQLTNNYGDFKESIGAIITSSPALISVINTTSTLVASLNNSLFDIAKGDPLKPLLLGFASVARLINDNLIPPFRIFFGFVQTGFSVLRTGVQTIVTAIAVTVDTVLGSTLQALSFLPGAVGKAAGEAAEILSNVSESTQMVLSDMASSTFDNLVTLEQTEDFRFKIDSIISKYEEGIQKSREFKSQVTNSFQETSEDVDKNAKSIAQSLNNTLGNSIASGIESISKSLAKGEDVFKAFGQAALGLVADFAIQAGKLFVATGIAQLALFSSPAASIAAGAALIAAGTLAKEFFGGSKGGDASAPAGVVQGGPLPTQPEFLPTQQEERRADQSVQLIVQGDILDSEDTGRRLIKLLNDNFESEASALTAVRFA